MSTEFDGPPTGPRHGLGERLRSARRRRGEPLREVALRAGISLPYLSDLERGKVANPSLDVLRRLSEALAVPMADLVEDGRRGRPPRGAKEPLERFLRRPGIADELAEEARRSGRSGPDVRADWERSLGAIEHRGRRPGTPEDWERLYRALRESLGDL